MRRSEGGLNTSFQNETAVVRRRVFSPVSAVRVFFFFQAMDVPVVVMCPCWRGATSLASQLLEKKKPFVASEKENLHENHVKKKKKGKMKKMKKRKKHIQNQKKPPPQKMEK